MRVPRRLGRAFARASDNLVLLLIINGLRTQIPDPRRAFGGPPKLDPRSLKRITADLKAAVNHRDGTSAASSMRELIELMRAAARERLHTHGARIEETLRTHRARAGQTRRSRGSSAGETARTHHSIAREAST